MHSKRLSFLHERETHDHLAQQRSRNGQRGNSTRQLYRIPAALPQEIIDYLHKMPEGQAVEKLWKSCGKAVKKLLVPQS